MDNQVKDELKPGVEQIIYANILTVGVWLGIFLLVLTYFLYLGGILSPHADMSLIMQNWDKGVADYLQITETPKGWGWVFLLNKGDFLNYLGFALLALMSIVCYMVLVVGYMRSKDWMFFAICALEILVLGLAASGLLGSGGH